jgi:hypothetical protein
MGVGNATMSDVDKESAPSLHTLPSAVVTKLVPINTNFSPMQHERT